MSLIAKTLLYNTIPSNELQGFYKEVEWLEASASECNMYYNIDQALIVVGTTFLPNDCE
jgi:hypothetical protein